MSNFFTPRKKQDTTSSKKPSAKRRLFTIDEEEATAPAIIASVVSPSKSVTKLETPQKKKARIEKKAVVTPDKDEIIIVEPPKEEKKEEYVPTYIHKNLSYQREGKASLDENTKSTFNLIQKNFKVPDDFETNHKFGPISGNCHELRVISAYNLSLLEPTNKDDAAIDICSECAVIGHKRVDCPSLI